MAPTCSSRSQEASSAAGQSSPCAGQGVTVQSTPFLIIGGGLAAASAAEALAKKHPGCVSLVSAEHHLPYARPPLSKAVLSGHDAPSSVYLRRSELYRDRQIHVVLGDAAIGLDADKQTVTLSSGRQLAYEKALLATGLVPAPLAIPGFSLPGVHTLRYLEDALALRTEIASSRTVVIIGGGFVGCEVAATAISLGANVHIVEMDSVLMERAVGRDVGALLTERHRSAGVTTHLGATAVEIQGELRARTVRLDSGVVIACDVVVVGVGSRAATSWLSGTNVELSGGGIVVDGCCRTSHPQVYAAGDVATTYSPVLGRYVRTEHESNAQHQGVVAARNMLGGTKVCDSLPFVWSKQFDLDMWCVGETRGYDGVELAGNVSSYEFVAVYQAQGQTIGVFGVNSTAMGAARKLLRSEGERFSAVDLLDAAAR